MTGHSVVVEYFDVFLKRIWVCMCVHERKVLMECHKHIFDYCLGSILFVGQYLYFLFDNKCGDKLDERLACCAILVNCSSWPILAIKCKFHWALNLWTSSECSIKCFTVVGQSRELSHRSIILNQMHFKSSVTVANGRHARVKPINQVIELLMNLFC